MRPKSVSICTYTMHQSRQTIQVRSMYKHVTAQLLGYLIISIDSGLPTCTARHVLMGSLRHQWYQRQFYPSVGPCSFNSHSPQNFLLLHCSHAAIGIALKQHSKCRMLTTGALIFLHFKLRTVTRHYCSQYLVNNETEENIWESALKFYMKITPNIWYHNLKQEHRLLSILCTLCVVNICGLPISYTTK